jgi:putative FmdB family regulatory protein
MPIYDYLCSNCGQTTEVIHGIDAPVPRFCPVCGAEGTLRKTIAAPAVLFKGSGWAKKDRSSASGARSKAGSGPGSSSGDGADAGSKSSAPDSKPASGETKASSTSSSTSEG